jgi:hypothetical protein
MSDSKLRSDLIRLASRSTPAVRKALLPLLSKKAGAGVADKKSPTAVFKQALKALKDAEEALAEFEVLTKGGRGTGGVGRDEELFRGLYQVNVELNGMIDHFEESYEAD